MALSILRPLMYFLISMISTPKKVWFHLSQWFQRGLIVKVYRGQRMPNCSNTSHDRYNLHQSCVPDLYHTTEGLFSGGGGTPQKRGTFRCMTTLEWRIWRSCDILLSLGIVVWTFRLNLLLWKHLANWNQTWHDMNVHWIVSYKNLCCCFKRGRFHIIYIYCFSRFFSSASASSQRSLSGP